MIAFIHVGSQVLEAGYQLLSSLLVVACDAIRGAWIEGLVVALALHVYLSNSRRTPKEQTHNPALRKKGAASGCKTGSRRNGQSKSTDAQKVQSLVVSLLGPGSRCTREIFELYEELVKGKHVDLRRHIPDENNARSMYIALIGCVASYPNIGTPKFSTAETSDSCPQHYISQLLSDMRTFGFQRTAEFYRCIQRSLINNQLFQEALWLYSVMIDDDMIPTVNMYVSFMNVAIACNDTDKVLFFFNEVSKVGPPSLRTYMTVLRVHQKNKDWEKAAELLDVIKSAGVEPDNLILNNVLGLCVDAGQVAKAESLLHHWNALADVVSCNILLKGYAQYADFGKSEKELDRMCFEGPAPNLITLNTIMDCAVRALQVASSNCKRSQPRTTNFSGKELADCGLASTKDMDEDGLVHSPPASSGDAPACEGGSHAFMVMARRSWDLLDRMLQLGLEPDRYTCSTLVKGMHLAGCTVADIDRAVELLRHIGREALQLQDSSMGSSQGANTRLLEVVFNTLLDACITARDLDRMAKIFEMMQEFGVSISSVTYGTLIKAFGQAGRISRCRQVWAEMKEAKVHPTIVTYGCYMDACIKNEDVDAAEEIFSSMAASGVRPNAVIYTSLIRGFAHSKQPGKALELYHQMRKEGIEATSVTFNSVLDVVSRQLSEPDVLHEILDDMRKATITPDAVTYSILIKASCSTGNLKKALALFRHIRSHGLVLDQVSFNTLLLACSKAERISDAEDILEEMRRLDMTPTPVTTSIIVKMYGKAKMLDKAISFSELMELEHGQKPNLFVYTCLIQACAQNKHVRRSWDIFNKMLRAGVEPDAITFGTVIHGCVYLNKFDYAMVLVRHAYMKPPLEDVEFDIPFATDAISLKKPIPLQHDVLRMLLTTLKRKEQGALIAELETIISEDGVAESAPKMRRPRGN